MITKNNSGNSFNQIIELEYIDRLTAQKGGKVLVISSLFLLINHLNNLDEFNAYRFDVIKYGFQGYYPVIGVKYLNENLDYYTISEELENIVSNLFEQMIARLSLKDFLDFTMENYTDIANIARELK